MKKKRPIIAVLVLISSFSVLLVVARVQYSGYNHYTFLIWNLFLAWLPLLFACLAVKWRQRSLPAVAMLVLWLLFLPNAPYLLTDLIHLRAVDPVPLWYDLILLLDFALLGLFLGFVSLHLMHALVADHFGMVPAWSFVAIVSGLCGLGVFIGRFLRWNSWDLFIQPAALASSITRNLSEPRTLAVSGLLALFLLLTYLFFWLLAGIDDGFGFNEASSKGSRSRLLVEYSANLEVQQ